MEAEHSGRVPLEFTWSIDDGDMHAEEQQQCLSWCDALWKRTRKALCLTNASDGVPNAQHGSSGELMYRDMLEVLKRDELLSLYTKVRHLFFWDNTTANGPVLLDWTGVCLVLHLLDSKLFPASASGQHHTPYAFQIGSLIFCKTEGWDYGSAMYFCELYQIILFYPTLTHNRFHCIHHHRIW
jgi:hypothetical protein